MFTYYEGQRRTDKQWKPKSQEWDDFTERFSEPVRTRETFEEYKRMSKADKGLAKDVGGFVGGVLKGGIRKKANVQWRSLLALDADNALTDLIEKVRALGIRCAIYSTHSHTPEKPKFRIIIPLTSPVDPDAYPALINYFAVLLGVEQFDPTTDEPHRLMYWPSCSKDGEYIYEKIDGELFDGNMFLEENPQWRDVATWELSERKRASRAAVDKAQDPREKTGIIGAFCRVYDIHAAIETFLPEIYVGGEDGRYTYSKGTTGGGVVTYDDLWSFSHHATDPTSGRLCNAFDLVRLHMFSEQDAEAPADTPFSRLPSYELMKAHAADLPDVAEELVMSRLAEAQEAFGDDGEDTSWVRQLTVTQRGEIQDTIGNCSVILLNDPKLKGKITYSEFKDRIIAAPDLPWRGGRNGSWCEADMERLYQYFEATYAIRSRVSVRSAWYGIRFDVGFHPVREYLEVLSWDGVKRLDTMLIDYLGADDTEYVRAVTRKWAVAAVKRIMEPGCQFDHMLLLLGKQGKGKSQFLKKLAGEDWYSDSINSLDGAKGSAEALQGYWIVCADELSALDKVGEAQEQAKNFITRTVDSYRPAYGHFVEDHPRQCVFAGTTNKDVFLRDYTGNRRYWPVQTHLKPHIVWTPEFAGIRDSLWAEAVAYYTMGEETYLSDELEDMARVVQEKHTNENSMVGLVREFIHTLLPECYDEMSPSLRHDWYQAQDPEGTVRREYVTAYQVYCELMGYSPHDFPKKKQYEVNEILKSMPELKLSGQRRIPQYGKQRIYEIVERAE